MKQECHFIILRLHLAETSESVCSSECLNHTLNYLGDWLIFDVLLLASRCRVFRRVRATVFVWRQLMRLERVQLLCPRSRSQLRPDQVRPQNQHYRYRSNSVMKKLGKKMCRHIALFVRLFVFLFSFTEKTYLIILSVKQGVI